MQQRCQRHSALGLNRTSGFFFVVLGIVEASSLGGARGATGRLGFLQRGRSPPPVTSTGELAGPGSPLDELMRPQDPVKQRSRSEYDPADPPQWPSGYDAREYYNAALGIVADAIHTPTAIRETWVDRIVEGTCERACMRCHIEKPSTQECDCFANCRLGPLPDQMCDDSSETGWSNKVLTRPEQTWQASCGRGRGHGGFNCTSSCMDQDFVQKMDECKTANQPENCMESVKALYKPVLELPPSATFFCTHPHLPSCDTFVTVPVSKTLKWECFATHAACMASMLPEEYPSDPRDGISVWDNVPLREYHDDVQP